MKIAPYVAMAFVALGLLAALRIALSNYRGERADFQRTPPSDISRHPERAGVPGLTEIGFGSPGQPRIAAWYVASRNRAAIVLVHGTEADRSSLLNETQFLAEAGFGVLALDLPGQGASEGQSQWGVPERQAIGAAIDWLGHRPEVDPGRIGAFGLSMGAYVLAQAAAFDHRLRAVVLAASPTDVVEQVRLISSRWGPLSQLPSYWALRNSGMPLDMRPMDVIGRIAPRALLILGGDRDSAVPEYMARQLFANAGNPKALWIVPGAHHGDYARAAPREYPARLIEFFRQNLLN